MSAPFEIPRPCGRRNYLAVEAVAAAGAAVFLCLAWCFFAGAEAAVSAAGAAAPWANETAAKAERTAAAMMDLVIVASIPILCESRGCSDSPERAPLRSRLA